MQTRQSFLGWWDHFRQANGIALRVVASLPTNTIHTHPITNMRTPTELLVHAYGMIVRNIPTGITTGEITSFDEKTAVANIKTTDDLVRFCQECWTAGDTAAKKVTDANLAAMVKTPWGMDMPGFAAAGVISDEYFHHRGQLYAYARALGLDVPMMWDFGHNAPEFAPQAAASA